MNQDSVYRIGQLGRTHGLRGELTFLFTDDVFDRTDADYLVLMVDGLLVPFFIEEYRFASDTRAFIKFEDVDTMEQASRFVNTEVFFPREISHGEVPLSSDIFVGYSVHDMVTDVTTSPIHSIDTSTDNPLFVLSDGSLIPIAQEWIQDIDHKEKTIHMALPEGLLTL